LDFININISSHSIAAESIYIQNYKIITYIMDLTALELSRKYPTTDGTRYFWDARYITTSFDASPKVLVETERLLRTEEGILRFFTIRGKTSIERCRGNSYRNPYLSVGSK
jgi:Ribosomal protein S6